MEENICPICGGVLRIEFTVGFEQCRPKDMRVTELPPDFHVCVGHPAPPQNERFSNMIRLGLTTEGERHKQWVLWQLGRMFDADVSGIEADEGIEPPSKWKVK